MGDNMQFKEIVHWAYDMPQNYHALDDCFMNNLGAPVVRSGAEPFKSYYSCEWSYHGYHMIDPSRSMAEMVLERIKFKANERGGWPACDMLGRLMVDLGLAWDTVTKADALAFWTLFPAGTADYMADSYMKYSQYQQRNVTVLRVINNPFFYKDANAPERRLVEIAEVGGFRFALDRACCIAQPSVLAKELALLNYGCNEPCKVDAVAEGLTTEIAEVLDDWGLAPTRS